MVLWLVLENLIFFVILTKHILLERSDCQGSIFGNGFVIDMILWQKMIDFVTENCIQKSIEFGCNPVDIFGIVPRQNLTGITIVVISTSRLEHNLVRHIS